MYIYMCVYVYIYTHTNTHTHTHMYIKNISVLYSSSVSSVRIPTEQVIDTFKIRYEWRFG